MRRWTTVTRKVRREKVPAPPGSGLWHSFAMQMRAPDEECPPDVPSLTLVPFHQDKGHGGRPLELRTSQISLSGRSECYTGAVTAARPPISRRSSAHLRFWPLWVDFGFAVVVSAGSRDPPPAPAARAGGSRRPRLHPSDGCHRCLSLLSASAGSPPRSVVSALLLPSASSSAPPPPLLSLVSLLSSTLAFAAALRSPEALRLRLRPVRRRRRRGAPASPEPQRSHPLYLGPCRGAAQRTGARKAPSAPRYAFATADSPCRPPRSAIIPDASPSPRNRESARLQRTFGDAPRPQRRPAPLPRHGEHPVSVLRDEDRVLELRRPAPVRRDHGPVVAAEGCGRGRPRVTLEGALGCCGPRTLRPNAPHYGTRKGGHCGKSARAGRALLFPRGTNIRLTSTRAPSCPQASASARS